MTETIGAIGYGIAAALFFLLSIQLLSSWRGRLAGGLLVFAALATMGWALVGVYYCRSGELEAGYWQALEALRNLAWFAFMLHLMGLTGGSGASVVGADEYAGVQPTGPIDASVTPVDGETTGQPTAQGWLAHFELPVVAALGLCLFLLGAGIFKAVTGASALVVNGLQVGHLGGLVSSVVGLVLIEQVFRNVRSEYRWGIKFFCLGVGGLYAYDFFFYSDALLFHRLDVALVYARAMVDAMAVPLIAVAVARNPQWSVDIFVSRRVVFHSATLLGAGIYLLAMAAGGYYLRIYGGTWGLMAQAVFLFGAAVLLLVLLFSGQMRAKLKIFLSKHFFRYKYDYREEWLRFTAALSSGDAHSQVKERALQALADLVESPGGLMWLRGNGNGFVLAASWNMSEPEAAEAADGALADFLERRGWVIDLHELELHPESYPQLALSAWLRALPRAWLLVPLIHHDRLLGFVLLTDARTRHRLNWEDYDLFKTAARQAASYIAQQQASQALAEARQFEAYSRLSTFVIHDLKNLITQLSLLVKNAERHMHNPEFMEDAVDTVRLSVEKMQGMLEQLRADNLVEDEVQARMDLCHVTERAVADHRRGRPEPELHCEQRGLEVNGDRDQFVAVLGHLIQNAQDATPEHGWVRVTVSCQATDAIIDIHDNGAGMDRAFVRERLFRPFDSTKGSKGMGVGAYQSREVIQKMGGRLSVTTAPGEGTRFRIMLPLQHIEDASSG